MGNAQLAFGLVQSEVAWLARLLSVVHFFPQWFCNCCMTLLSTFLSLGQSSIWRIMLDKVIESTALFALLTKVGRTFDKVSFAIISWNYQLLGFSYWANIQTLSVKTVIICHDCHNLSLLPLFLVIVIVCHFCHHFSRYSTLIFL